MLSKLRIYDVNEGHCQVTYVTKNVHNERIFYCLQDNWGIKPMRCTQDGEPQNEVRPNDWSLWEIPQGDSKIEIKAREFLESKVSHANQ